MLLVVVRLSFGVFCNSVKILARKIVSEMIHNVSMGTLNPTQLKTQPKGPDKPSKLTIVVNFNTAFGVI